MIKIKSNLKEVKLALNRSLKAMGIEKKRLSAKIYNKTPYGPFVERGWGGPVNPLSTPGGKESFNVGFSPRYMMRGSLKPTHEYFINQLSGVLKDPRKDLDQLKPIFQNTLYFGIQQVSIRTPIQFWLEKTHLIDDWRLTEIQEK